MQWLNPKAWLASLAGMGAYAADGDGRLVWQFTVVYFVVLLSVDCPAGRMPARSCVDNLQEPENGVKIVQSCDGSFARG